MDDARKILDYAQKVGVLNELIPKIPREIFQVPDLSFDLISSLYSEKDEARWLASNLTNSYPFDVRLNNLVGAINYELGNYDGSVYILNCRNQQTECSTTFRALKQYDNACKISRMAAVIKSLM